MLFRSMFATPTVFMQPGTDGGGWVQALLALNPMTGLIAAFRASVLGTPIPWSALGLASIAVVGICLLGCYYFRRMEDSFADIIFSGYDHEMAKAWSGVPCFRGLRSPC